MPDGATPEFAGQVAVVTGGADGIGKAISLGLAAGGADVVIIDIKPAALDELKAVAAGAGQRFAAWHCDVTKAEQVTQTCREIEAALGAPSILVNNVGGSGDTQVLDVEDLTDDQWEGILSLNLGSAFRFCRALVPGMKRAKYGRIVNISSGLKEGIFGPQAASSVRLRLPYITAKGAIVSFTKQLAKDLGPHGITANVVAPGFTLPGENARITQRYRAMTEEQKFAITGSIPMGRPATGEDIAGAVCFLVSPRNRYISGETLNVSGGNH